MSERVVRARLRARAADAAYVDRLDRRSAPADGVHPQQSTADSSGTDPTSS